jgi:hypothetical protein
MDGVSDFQGHSYSAYLSNRCSQKSTKVSVITKSHKKHSPTAQNSMKLYLSVTSMAIGMGFAQLCKASLQRTAVDGRIIGGTLAAAGAYPSYAIPETGPEGLGLCGASLIHEGASSAFRNSSVMKSLIYCVIF